jgi:proteasome activator subunit 4
MFSKDPMSASFTQISLRALAILEPGLVMPQIVERAAEGLEVINETHRTTAVLSTLAVVALPLVNENIWFGGQTHLLNLLDLSLPGIDMASPDFTLDVCKRY